MPQYVAFLRGVSPMNCKMSDLKRALEEAGFTDVKTVLSSGNAIFTSKKSTENALEKKIEKALEKDLGKKFGTIVRSMEDLRKFVESEPFTEFKLTSKHKPVVTLLKDNPKVKMELPVTKDGATIFKIKNRAILSAYTPSPKGAVFMVLIERTFGKEVTTRTLETLKKLTR